MDKKGFEDRVSRIKEVNAVLEKVDATVRAEVFAMLKPYITGQEANSPKPTKEEEDDETVDLSGDGAEFFRTYSGKAAANVRMIAAYHYSKYGTSPFTTTTIKDIASETGETVPNRIDMTLKGALEDGHSLFRQLPGGKYAPTVHGEAYFKETYKVKKGTAKPPTGDGE